MTFVSGFILSTITIKRDNNNLEEDSIYNSNYYNKLMEWIRVSNSKEQSESKSTLKGIKIFLIKKDEKMIKNIIRLYFCDEESDEWKEVVSEKIIRADTLTSELKQKLKSLKNGDEIEITDMIFNN